MAIGSRSHALYTQSPAQSTSTGQTRAHEWPSRFCSKMVAAAPRTLPDAIFLMKVGMSISVGQALMQGASAQ